MKRYFAALGLVLLMAGCARYERAIEYVTVTFPEKRAVFIDGERNGSTNEVLKVDTGTHVFDLRPGTDFEPATHKVVVKDTTVLAPLVIEFRRKGAP